MVEVLSTKNAPFYSSGFTYHIGAPERRLDSTRVSARIGSFSIIPTVSRTRVSRIEALYRYAPTLIPMPQPEGFNVASPESHLREQSTVIQISKDSQGHKLE
jgi:hypothetical protein